VFFVLIAVCLDFKVFVVCIFIECSSSENLSSEPLFGVAAIALYFLDCLEVMLLDVALIECETLRGAYLPPFSALEALRFFLCLPLTVLKLLAPPGTCNIFLMPTRGVELASIGGRIWPELCRWPKVSNDLPR